MKRKHLIYQSLQHSLLFVLHNYQTIFEKINRDAGQVTNVSILAQDFGRFYLALGVEDGLLAPIRARGSERRSGSLGTDRHVVNMSERQVTTLVIALSSSFTLLVSIERLD